MFKIVSANIANGLYIKVVLNALKNLMLVIAKLTYHSRAYYSGYIQLHVGTVAATIVNAALNPSSKGSNLFLEK